MPEAIADPPSGPPKDMGDLEKEPEPDAVEVESFVDDVTVSKT
ncbi:MAG: hypothetical protein AB7G10_21530 [Reyranellaceae bacterium]